MKKQVTKIKEWSIYFIYKMDIIFYRYKIAFKILILLKMIIMLEKSI